MRNTTESPDPILIQSPVVRRAIAALVAIGLVVIVAKGILPTIGTTRGDFANYYTAARMTLDRESLAQAYTDFSWFQRKMDRYGIHRQVGGFTPHPPPTAIALLPLAVLDPVTARTIWSLVNLVLLAGVVVVLARLSRLPLMLTALIVLSAGFGLLNNFLFGQLYLLLLLSIVLGLYLEKKGHPVWAGICLGVLIPIKYFGIFFVLFLACRKKWVAVLATGVTCLAVMGLSLVLTGLETWRVFLDTVLPRHLMGEIQDPFSVALQTINSLYRRLFLYEPLLNPNPLVESPFLFALFKNISFWGLGAAALLVLVGADFQDRSMPGNVANERRRIFRLAWIPLAVLTLSPAAATYHFLLATLSCALLVRLLLEGRQTREAVAVWAAFVFVNLPHFVYLKQWLPAGGLAVFAYSRLFALLAFCLFVVYLFREHINLSVWRPRVACAVVGVLVSVTTLANWWTMASRPNDEVHSLLIPDGDFNRNLGLIVQNPSVAGNDLVFGYCELFEDRYSLYSGKGQRIETGTDRNSYRPARHPDGTSLLFETVAGSRQEIWIAHDSTSAQALLEGREPSWDPSGETFVFVRDDGLFVADTDGQARQLFESPFVASPVYSAHGRTVFFLLQNPASTDILRLDPQTGVVEPLHSVPGRISELTSSPEGDILVYAWESEGNHDLWSIRIADGEVLRLTEHPAIDREPAWDAANERIIFASDRGRGLGCTNLFWMPIPGALR